MLEILKEFGIPETILKLVKITLDNSRCRVLTEGKISEYFKIMKGTNFT